VETNDIIERIHSPMIYEDSPNTTSICVKISVSISVLNSVLEKAREVSEIVCNSTLNQRDTRVKCQVPFTPVPSNTRPDAVAIHNVCAGNGSAEMAAKPLVSIPFSSFWN
jgi:hypothetical protein